MKRLASALRARHGLLMLGWLALGSLTACSLEEEPYSSFNTDTLYASAGGAELGLVGAYSPLNGLYYGPAALLAPDFSADQVYPRAVVGRNTLTLFNYDAGYTTQKSFSRLFESPQYIWQACYQGVEKANQVLDRVPAATMDEARKQTILGEARFLRAFYFWMLTKNFGDVVLKTSASTTTETAVVGKSPQADVYKQIFADLDVAVAALPSGLATRKGSPSKEAALALYAKAALYAGNYAVARDKAQQVIASGKYSLLPNVYDIYDVNQEDAARVENIWAFEGERTAISDPSVIPGPYTFATGLYGPANSSGPAYGKSTFGSVFAYQAFYNSFAPADRRRTLLATSYVNGAGATVPQAGITPITAQGVLVRKYQDANSIGVLSSSNVPILRLADVYLIAAEAEARATGASAAAYANVNAVRTRAGLPGLTPGLSQTAFIDAVLQERSWELFAEGDRWYDLTRTDKFLTVIPAAVNSVFPVRTPLGKHKYFPIPQDEINANAQLTQNAGW